MIVNSEHPLLLIRQQSMNDSSEVTESNEVMNEKSMAELQLEDPDIGPILQLRLQCSDQDPPEDVLAEPEAAKVLRGQWHNLRIRDGTLYQELIGKYGRPTVLQLVIPRVRETEFIRSCHEGMTGDIEPSDQLWIKCRDVDFGLDGVEMCRDSVDNVRTAQVIIEDVFLDLYHCSP